MQRETVGLNQGIRWVGDKPAEDDRPTLSEAGIDKMKRGDNQHSKEDAEISASSQSEAAQTLADRARHAPLTLDMSGTTRAVMA